MPVLVNGSLGLLFMAHLSNLQGRVVLCGAGQAANGIDDRPGY